MNDIAEHIRELLAIVEKRREVEHVLYNAAAYTMGERIEGKSVLEIGAGDGLLAGVLSLRAKRVLALEPCLDGSQERFDSRIQGVVEWAPNQNVEWVSTTLQEWNGCVEEFDVVVLANSINHLDEIACETLLEDPASRATYNRIFLKLGRALRPGGVVVASDCARRNLFGDLRIRNPVTPQIEWKKHRGPSEWGAVLKESGLEIEEVRWSVPYPLRRLAWLFSRKLVAYSTISHFCLKARKSHNRAHDLRSS